MNLLLRHYYPLTEPLKSQPDIKDNNPRGLLFGLIHLTGYIIIGKYTILVKFILQNKDTLLNNTVFKNHQDVNLKIVHIIFTVQRAIIKNPYFFITLNL